MEIRKFGTVDDQEAFLYIVENEYCRLECCDYGARIVSFVLKDKNIDPILGFDNVDGYINNSYIGATIGRVCNRIANGQFTLNNVTYNLAQNNACNTLHGGQIGFDKKIFDTQIEDKRIKFTYHSPDMEEGFPGNLDLEVTYDLLEDGFEYSYQAYSDQDTLCSITNHAFFNLNGQNSADATDCRLIINAKEVSKVDENGCTLEEVFDVCDTPFDFTSAKIIGEELLKDDQQLTLGNGFDHNYCFGNTDFKDVVKLSNDKLTMTVSTDMPCMHFYSGNFLDESDIGKNGYRYPRRSGICFETQYYPSAISYKSHQAPILRAQQIQKHRTRFTFK